MTSQETCYSCYLHVTNILEKRALDELTPNAPRT